MRSIASLAIALLAVPVMAAAAPKTTVSVMDLNTSSGLSRQELMLLTDKLLNSLVEYRVFEVVERSKRDEILKEQGFQMTGACSEASCLVEVGQLLGAQKMIGGTIGTLGGVYVAELRMIDIKTGGIDLTFSRNYGKIADLLAAMKEAAEIFSSWKPSGGGQSAKPGGLFVISEPQGAKILVDGSEHPRTTPDLVYPLAEGLHQVSLVKDGFSLYSASRLVSVGKVDTLNAPLMSLAGKLKIRSNPAGAKVYLNGAYQGTTGEQGLAVDELRDSSYAIKAVKWGYRTYRSAWKPDAGRETRIDARLPLRRWKVHFFSMDVMGTSSSFSSTSSSSSNPSGDTLFTLNDDDLTGTAVGGTAGAGYALSRNITLNLFYQFRIYPGGINKELRGNWNGIDTVLVWRQMKIDLITHTPLLGVAVTIPWGRLEPYAELRGGLALSARAKINYDYQYQSRPSATSAWTTDSLVTRQVAEKIEYLTAQFGAGFLIWLRPDREALRLYWMLCREHFQGFTLPGQQEMGLGATGTQFGLGLTVHF